MANGLEDVPFQWIADDLWTGKCIPFLGAGASAYPTGIDIKPPSASALAFELARESIFPPYKTWKQTDGDAEARERHFGARRDCENLMLVSSWVEYSMGDRPRLHDKLREHLANENRPLPHNDLHKLLARTAKQKAMAIITTNYDDLVEQALTEHGVAFDLFVIALDRNDASAPAHGTMLFRAATEDKLKPVTGEEQMLDLDIANGQVRLNRTAVFKIHGHIGRSDRADDTFVITEEDYVFFLGRMSAGTSVIPADLVTLMKSRTLLFLGYGLRDWNFRVLLARINRMRAETKRSYAINRDFDEAEQRLWTERKVEFFRANLNEFVPRLAAELTEVSAGKL